MNFTEFEFAHPEWLLLVLIPLLLFYWKTRRPPSPLRVQNYADAHLLPHLLVSQTTGRDKQRLWIVLWLLGTIALAGPRWDYEEQEVLKPHANLMIILDLSDSMRVQDLPHSRFEEAMQNIADLLDAAQEIYVGLLGYAGIPHLIAPFSDDYQTVRHLLYELNLNLVPIQGSQLTLALEQAIQWSKGQGIESVAHLLLISDGEFTPDDLATSLKLLQRGQFHLHTLGVGTVQGDFIPLQEGKWKRDAKGEVIISRLNEVYLQQLAVAGRGIYRQANYHHEDTDAILAEVRKSINDATQDKTLQRLWHERFYLLVGLMMILLLTWFRRQNLSAQGR